MQSLFEQKERDLGFVQEIMDLIIYTIERLVDIVAALILRAGYCWVDQFFAATGTNGEADDVWVPLGTHLRTGSGGILSSIGGSGSQRDSSGGQPIDGSGDVIGGGNTVLDFPGPE